MNLHNYKGYRIRIEHDDNSDDPDDWEDEDRFLIYHHREFTIERAGFDVHEINKAEDEYYIFPVEAYIHSGVSLSLFKGHKQCRFDSSVTGFILVARNYADDNTEQAELYAEGLVETWNHYLSGNVYGFVTYENKPYYSIPKKSFDKCVEDNISILEFKDKLILSDDWNEIDSCWGYYGDPNISGLLEEAKSVIDNLVSKSGERDLLLQR